MSNQLHNTPQQTNSNQFISQTSESPDCTIDPLFLTPQIRPTIYSSYRGDYSPHSDSSFSPSQSKAKYSRGRKRTDKGKDLQQEKSKLNVSIMHDVPTVQINTNPEVKGEERSFRNFTNFGENSGNQRIVGENSSDHSYLMKMDNYQLTHVYLKQKVFMNSVDFQNHKYHNSSSNLTISPQQIIKESQVIENQHNFSNKICFEGSKQPIVGPSTQTSLKQASLEEFEDEQEMKKELMKRTKGLEKTCRIKKDSKRKRSILRKRKTNQYIQRTGSE